MIVILAQMVIDKRQHESEVGEFRKFLETAVDGYGKRQSVVLETK